MPLTLTAPEVVNMLFFNQSQFSVYMSAKYVLQCVEPLVKWRLCVNRLYTKSVRATQPLQLLVLKLQSNA